VTDLKIFFERAGEPGTDEIFEAFPAEDSLHSLAADLLADTCVDNYERFAVKMAADRLDAFTGNGAAILKQPNEVGTFRGQGKGDRDHLAW